MGNEKSTVRKGNLATKDVEQTTASAPLLSIPSTASPPTTKTPNLSTSTTMSRDPGAPIWEYEKEGKWIAYDSTTIRLLDGICASGRGNTVLNHGSYAGGNQVIIDFINLTQQPKEGKGKKLKIRRTPPLANKRTGLTSSAEKRQIADKVKECKGFDDVGESKRNEVKRATKWKKVKGKPEESCPICLCSFDPSEDAAVVQLSECQGHAFHRECIVHCFKSGYLQCPICGKVYGIRVGNQPPGTMNVRVHPKGTSTCSGYETYGTIEINYSFPNGTQTSEHPHPGQPFTGTSRTAYLPDNDEGREVLRLLKLGFERKLLFMVGRSVTTGADNQVVWGGIHHKTSLTGGTTNFGYPDPTYFDRVKSELAAKGVE